MLRVSPVSVKGNEVPAVPGSGQASPSPDPGAYTSLSTGTVSVSDCRICLT
jgi:hypothetical protein